jgi:transcriptional regulator with XRE-family HTH domain
MTFAECFKAARKEAGLSQADISKRSGIHNTEISRIERGLRDPRLSTIYRLADALNMPPGKLLNR